MGSDLHWNPITDPRDSHRYWLLKIKTIEGMLYKAKADVGSDPDHPFADIIEAAEIETLERVLAVLRETDSDEDEKTPVVEKLARESWG